MFYKCSRLNLCPYNIILLYFNFNIVTNLVTQYSTPHMSNEIVLSTEEDANRNAVNCFLLTNCTTVEHCVLYKMKFIIVVGSLIWKCIHNNIILTVTDVVVGLLYQS